MSIQVN
jgi:hypothetical protein